MSELQTMALSLHAKIVGNHLMCRFIMSQKDRAAALFFMQSVTK